MREGARLGGRERESESWGACVSASGPNVLDEPRVTGMRCVSFDKKLGFFVSIYTKMCKLGCLKMFLNKNDVKARLHLSITGSESTLTERCESTLKFNKTSKRGVSGEGATHQKCFLVCLSYVVVVAVVFPSSLLYS